MPATARIRSAHPGRARAPGRGAVPLAVAAALLALGALPGGAAPQEDSLPAGPPGAPEAGRADRAAPPAGAGPDTLSDLLRRHRHAFRLEGDSLVGPGARFLLGEARRASFFVVGEDHGVAEIPRLCAALFERMVPLGYRHLAIEASPTVARELEERARWEDPGLEAFAAEAGIRVPFYAWREERELLARVVRASPVDSGALWGLDQEYIAGTEMAFRRLYELAPDEAARELAARERKRAGYGMAAARHGDHSKLWLPSADSADFARLRAAFAGRGEALRLIDDLRASSRVYRLFFDGERYRSAALRERLLKRNFAHRWREAQEAGDEPTKVMVKFGGGHALRGRGLFTGVHGLGNFLSELAVSRGSRSFHLLVLGGEGSLTTEVGPGLAFRTSRGATTGARWLSPVTRVLPGRGWAVFDLRPLRPLLAEGAAAANPLLEQVIWGYDALAVLSGSTPASYE